MWILYAVGSSFFAGITAILAKCGIQKTDSDVATAVRTIVVLLFSWLMVFVTGTMSGIKDISGMTLLFLVLSGLATGASWLCYFHALQKGDINKVVPIDKSSTILTILLALIFLHEGLSWAKAGCVCLIGIGTMMMITRKETTDETTAKDGSWLIYAVLSAVFASLTAILGKIGISGIDSSLGTAIRTTVVLAMAWLMVFMKGKQHEVGKIEKKELLFIGLSGIATGASWLCYFKALQLGDVNKVVPIDKSSTILTIILAFIFLGEPITLVKGIAVVLIGIGTFMMIQKKEAVDEPEKPKGGSWLIYALLSTVFASLTAILGKVGIEGVESNLGTAIRTCVVLVMAWVVVFVKGKQHTIREIPKNELGFICLSGLATGGSWLCYYRALHDGMASVVVPIDKLSILVSIAFSYIVFRERLTKKAVVGLCLIVAGTLIMLL